MSEIINRRAGQVQIPGEDAPKGSYFQFDLEALERLETKYGENYLDIIIKALAKMQTSVYVVVIGATAKGLQDQKAPFGASWEDINIALLDALHLAINGRTYDEQKKFSEEQALERLKRLEGMAEDPQTAAALRNLFSQSVGETASDAD